MEVAIIYSFQPLVFGDRVMAKPPPILIEKNIGYTFKDKTILLRSLQPTSLELKQNNERLEFLGDRVLGLAIAEHLYLSSSATGSNISSDTKEGDLAKRLAYLASGDICEKVSETWQVAEYLRQENGQVSTVTPRVLADCCEAIIGAVYLDGGLEAAKSLVLSHWQSFFGVSSPIDAKSRLQEWSMQKHQELPVYAIVERTGPDHSPVFTVEVSLNSIGSARADAGSRRLAEQGAAYKLLSQAGLLDE